MVYPIKGFIETSFSDWPGKVAAVLFLPLCNFRCLYCHNHGLVLHPEGYADFPLEQILSALRERCGWIDGVCLTGGEPTLHPWLPSLIRELKSAPGLAPAGSSLGIKVDTNGTNPEVLRRLLKENLLDYVAMDLKAPLDPLRYAAVCGVPLGAEEMGRIESSIEFLLHGRVDFEFRTTLAPAFIGEEEIYDLARRVQGAPRYTLQNLNPRETLDRSLAETALFDPGKLKRMQERVNEIIKQTADRGPQAGD